MSRPPLSFLFPRDDGVPDAVLLRRYVADRDEAAFELLVRRHADAVWTVCRATAGDHHAAEDAFQAAFLTLAKKANSVRDHLAGWLHRVAYHAALKARPARGAAVGEPPAPEADGLPGDVAAAIHADLAALPDRYRLPLLLCDLEGLTHTEAARQLGWPVGSVSGRLVRGRERLKAKLVRRGVAPAAGGLTVLPLNAASPLIRTVVAGGPVSPAVATLSQGVLTAMRIAKLKLTAVVAAGVIGLAGVVTVLGVSTAQPPGDPPVATAKPAKKDARPFADAKQRAHSTNQIKQLVLACHNYHDAHGALPADMLKNDKPYLSWRVLILPYIGESELYKQFKLDEPWDSDHNKPLAETVVKAFTNGHEPGNTKYAMTFFQRPTGKGAIHDLTATGAGTDGAGLGASGPPGGAAAAGNVDGTPGPQLPSLPPGRIPLTAVTDGTSNTIFLIEAEKAVEWAKPDDLAFDLTKPTDLRGPFANVIHCGMGDGAVRTFAGGLGKDAAKFMIGRNDGHPFDVAGYRGVGVPGVEDPKEAAVLAKEIADATAELTKRQDENQKLRQELFKLRTDRLKKSGNVPLAGQLIDLERLLAAEKETREGLERELKIEKGVVPPKPVRKE